MYVPYIKKPYLEMRPSVLQDGTWCEGRTPYGHRKISEKDGLFIEGRLLRI